MYPRLFLAVLPALLSVVVPSLAIPVQTSDSLSVEARSFELSSDSQAILARDVADEISLFEREDVESDVFARAFDEEMLFPRAKKAKLSAADAKIRKDAMRTKVAHNQANNVVKKAHLQAEAAKLTKPYGKPRKLKYVKEITKKGKEHIVSGYRAESRAKDHRLPKQPKTPKPNFAKGEHKTNAKAVNSQAAASARRAERKANGRAKYGDAKAIHEQTLKHGNMPARKDQYHVPGVGVLKGKQVRQGAFNLALHEGKGGKYPVTFRNDEQGPADARHKPLPHMVGSGKEYPIQKGGYHPGDEHLGPVRGIYQDNARGADGKHAGYNLQGVISHDVTRDKSHPGYNDHIAIPRTPAPPKPKA
ncbi:hypothetical protein BDN70DRAFT_991250 [Pholiota conissans]|uniref:Uncharacterized protein n=1 Tax=Pholiota conissans TaxID=109636 RepID=A0A9P5Z8U9_9AGAR|nr:hypothetical protein BDN70DRAFT_991250 [Pholiota conissans]